MSWPFAQEALAELLSQYGLSSPDIRLLYPQQGADNLNITISLGESRYMLRVYKVTPREAIEFELHLIDDLVARGFPTPRIFQRLDRNLLSEIDGLPCALFDFVAGAPIERERSSNLAQVAQLTARLHLLTEGRRYPGKRRTDFDRLRDLQELSAESSSLRRKPGVEDFLRQIDRLLADFERLIERCGPQLGWGAIHHDLHSGNILVDAEGGILALLDFDEAHLSHLIFDIASLLHYWATQTGAGALDEQRARRVLEAYHATRTLTAAELAALADAVLIFFAADAADYLARSFRRDPEGTELRQCHSLQTFYHLRESAGWRAALML